MGTQIYIYKTRLDISRNMIIEDIEDYLTASASLTYSDTKFMYQPTALNKVIKIDLENANFSTLAGKDDASDIATLGNYIKIINKANADASEVVNYYYITRALYVAEKTISLTLQLDTLNTYYEEFKNKFTSRTRTTRQHKDRFWNNKIGSYYVRRFYDTNEGFNPQKLLQNKLYFSDYNAYGLQDEQTAWYLIDRTPTKYEQERTNAVVYSYLTFDDTIGGRTFVQTGYFNSLYDIYNALYGADAYPTIAVIDNHNNPNASYTSDIAGGTITTQYMSEKYNGIAVLIVELYYNVQLSRYEMALYECTKRGQNIINTSIINIVDLTRTNLEAYTLTNINKIHLEPDGIGAGIFLINHGTYSSIYNLQQTNGTNTLQVSTIDAVDTTDYLINNIFLLPYAPVFVDINYNLGQYVITADGLSVDSEASNILKVKNDIEYIRTWNNYGTASQYSSFIYENSQIVNLENANYVEQESRLYGSEFYNWGIHFAGQEALVNNEKFYFSNAPTSQPRFQLVYKVSNSFSGHFYFKIDWKDERATAWRSFTPTDNVVMVSNDNRIVLYQNNYLDYRRTMQYYDKQALATAQAQTWFNAGSSIANSLVMSGISAGMGSPVQATIGFASTISGQLGNAIFAQINNENSQAMKEASLASQRSIIRSGADADLQRGISGNKLYWVKYSCSEALRTNLARYFALYGYSCNDFGTPNLNTRKLWNYIECEADFDLNNNLVYQVYLNEIKQRFKEGCTIFHNNNNSWAIEQSNLSANWEIWYNEE